MDPLALRSGGHGVGTVPERQVGLVLLHGVQEEDGVQPVQDAAQVGDVVLVGGPVADVVDEPAEPGRCIRSPRRGAWN